MRRLVAVGVTVLLASVVVWGQTFTALTGWANASGRTDGNGSVMTYARAYSGATGPYTNFGNLPVRTDGNGSLAVTVAAGNITPDTVCVDGTNQDTCWGRGGAAGKMVLTGTTPMVQFGGTTNAFPALKQSSSALLLRLGDDSAYSDFIAGTLSPVSAQITIGAGTGISVLQSGSMQQTVYKVTILSTAFICAAVTCDVTIATLPAKTFLVHALADLTTTFACTGTCTTSTLSFTLGKTAGGNQYLLSVDADAATGQFGDAAAELGASLAPATAPTLIGDVASWTTTTAVVLRMTSGTGNIGTGAATNFSQGAATFYLTAARMP